jgi:hypothetical protein
MYVNQIDNIIDQILDQLYLEGLAKDETFKSIVEGKKINYVEYRDKINSFIRKFMETIDIVPIQKLINNKENLNRILDIIKRYVAYYYFLSIAYYYTGTIKEFRNNLIQYSKLQENSTFTIKNFFDTENNYQIINFFKIIKDVSNIMLMTDFQKKTLNPLDVKDAVNFLNNLGKDYIDNYLLMIVKIEDENIVEINVHNLIKTIVFGEIYRNQEQNMVFEILNDIEENKHEYTYIDIVVAGDDITDFESFRQLFLGEDNIDTIAKDLFELANDSSKISPIMSVDSKNNNLLEFQMLTPIVDDFLRYHRDTERLDIENEKAFTMPLVSTNNAKNIQMALLYQQRKKKENTRAQLIVNKIDAISDYYSDNVKNNPETLKEIKKFFQGPLSYRKAVLHNYLDEVRVMNKIRNQGRRAIESNEYYLELIQAISHAYFNFKDFQKYGTSVSINPEQPINMIRYSNIENKNQMSHLEIDMHTGTNDNVVNLVGLALGPFVNGPIQCVRKEDLVDIREIKISYFKDGKVVTKGTDNGYKAFIKIIKHFYINTISISIYPKFEIYNNYSEIRKLNEEIFNKVIYWIYDIEKDTYEMNTYENLKTYNFQESIRFMNSIIYDRIIEFLHKKLIKLIDENKDLPYFTIDKIIELYSVVNRLFLKQDDKREIIIKEYLRSIGKGTSKIMPVSDEDKIIMPEFLPIADLSTFRIKIDTINPLHPQPYRKIEAYSSDNKQEITTIAESKCQHEIEWNELIKLKSESLNKYNTAATQFMEKFAIETLELDYICNICGQVLPIKQWIQDGSFDNNTQKFVTAYVPSDIPLEEIKEYTEYKLVIRYLDALINRVSLITGTNMLVGPTSQIKQKRKALVKNIIDIIIKHNSVNLRKNQSDEDRLDFYSKKFHIDKDLDSVYFFELDDSIINFTSTASSVDMDINRLKYNNLLLYFILIFITELNGSQIAMMYNDNIANIYVYLKYGDKLFGDLLIKKNVNDMETVPIIKYPVLCYLLFYLSKYLISHKLWLMPNEQKKNFNPFYIKIIINSFVDLFNSISIDAGKMRNDYIYLLTSSKLYTQLNSTFKNNDIINLLKKQHIRFNPDRSVVIANVAVKNTEIETYSISNPIQIVSKTRKIPNFKISSGIIFDRPDKIIYPATLEITDLTNCPNGSYHKWITKGKDIVSINCNLTGEEATGEINRTNEAYYYNLSVIANRRCLQGTVHDFVGKDGQFICTICHRKLGEKYTNAELDILAKSLDRLENERIEEILKSVSSQNKIAEEEQTYRKELMDDLLSAYRKETGDKLYGQITNQIDKLINILESLIGSDTNLDIDKYPVYLRDNVYIIDHSYDGTIFNDPIILTEKDNRIIFKEDHNYFKTDVYYYSDKRTQIDVFYHAVTLKLLGYKEKHKEFVRINKANAYLKISSSIKNRLLTIGYQTQYIDVGDVFIKNSKIIKDIDTNYFQILDNLIRDHIYKIKSVIDKIISVLYKIKNYYPSSETELPQIYLQTTQAIDKLVTKYGKALREFKMGKENNSFDDWNELRNSFAYTNIEWEKTTVRPGEKFTITDDMYINSDLINYYDIPSNLMMYYTVNELISIIQSNSENNAKINIAQMYIEIIIYIYSIYNIDPYKNSLELKRFQYILNGSDVMVDILKRGQGLTLSKELEENIEDNRPDILETVELTEEQIEEMEDLKEEAEALDIEGDYFAEEDEDYTQEGEYEG